MLEKKRNGTLSIWLVARNCVGEASVCRTHPRPRRIQASPPRHRGYWSVEAATLAVPGEERRSASGRRSQKISEVHRMEAGGSGGQYEKQSVLSIRRFSNQRCESMILSNSLCDYLCRRILWATFLLQQAGQCALQAASDSPEIIENRHGNRRVSKLDRKYTRIANNGCAGSGQTRIRLSDAVCALNSCIVNACGPINRYVLYSADRRVGRCDSP